MRRVRTITGIRSAGLIALGERIESPTELRALETVLVAGSTGGLQTLLAHVRAGGRPWPSEDAKESPLGTRGTYQAHGAFDETELRWLRHMSASSLAYKEADGNYVICADIVRRLAGVYSEDTEVLARATVVLMGGAFDPFREAVRKLRADRVPPHTQDSPIGPAYLVPHFGTEEAHAILKAAISTGDVCLNPTDPFSYFVRADL